MVIPLIAFLFLYLLFVFGWLIFSFIAVYHMLRYGQINFVSVFSVLAYTAGCAAVLFFSYRYLSPIDWSAGFDVLRGGIGIFGVNNFSF